MDRRSATPRKEERPPPRQAAGPNRILTKPFDFEKAIQPDRERPENLAGAMLRVALYPYHWLTAGLDGEIQTVYEGARVFAPLKLDAGVNVGTYAPLDRLVAAGLVWKEAQPLLAGRALPDAPADRDAAT